MHLESGGIIISATAFVQTMCGGGGGISSLNFQY